jgi:hypothetical protein
VDFSKSGLISPEFGGLDRDRTDDLHNAIVALSQTELRALLVLFKIIKIISAILSLQNLLFKAARPAYTCAAKKSQASIHAQPKKMVVTGGIEPPTRGFSVLCSTD